MALGSAILVPLVLLAGAQARPAHSPHRSKSSQSRLGELSQILQETLSGNRVVKAFGMERIRDRPVPRARRAACCAKTCAGFGLSVLTSPLMDMLSAVVIVLVLLYARNEIKHGVMTIGTFVTFVYALIKAYEPVKGMGSVYQQFEQAHGATAQVFGFLALDEEVQDHAGSARAAAVFARRGIR